jgi:hypothetical protein
LLLLLLQATIELIRKAALLREPRKPFEHSEDTKLKMSASNSKKQPVVATNDVTGEIKEFSSVPSLL